MKILYIGHSHPSATSRHRAEALRRLGHTVEIADPRSATASFNGPVVGRINYRLGYLLTRGVIHSWLSGVLAESGAFDLCWVDNGEHLSAETVRMLRQRCRRVVLFNHDDPTGTRDYARFRTLRSAIPQYDLCIVVRQVNVAEFQAIGARQVMRVWMSYDEVAHAPSDRNRPVSEQFKSDVAFIGRNMTNEGRDLLLAHLIRQGLNVAIWGDNWQSSVVWSELQPHWRGASIGGQDYVDAIRGASICIGMLSKGNRDEHTTRSMEIPFAGGLLCAERTSEHLILYKENEEAIFWSSASECANACLQLLNDPAKMARIRQRGHARVMANKVGSEDLCRAALARIGQEAGQPA